MTRKQSRDLIAARATAKQARLIDKRIWDIVDSVKHLRLDEDDQTAEIRSLLRDVLLLEKSAAARSDQELINIIWGRALAAPAAAKALCAAALRDADHDGYARMIEERAPHWSMRRRCAEARRAMREALSAAYGDPVRRELLAVAVLWLGALGWVSDMRPGDEV